MKLAQEIFSALIKEGIIKSAYCSTYDHLTLSLCCDYQKSVSCHSYSFRSYIEVPDKLNEFSKPYADIGMIVAEKHRNKGIATFLVLKLKEFCLNNGFIPICGCWYHNYASKKH